MKFPITLALNNNDESKILPGSTTLAYKVISENINQILCFSLGGSIGFIFLMESLGNGEKCVKRKNIPREEVFEFEFWHYLLLKLLEFWLLFWILNTNKRRSKETQKKIIILLHALV